MNRCAAFRSILRLRAELILRTALVYKRETVPNHMKCIITKTAAFLLSFTIKIISFSSFTISRHSKQSSMTFKCSTYGPKGIMETTVTMEQATDFTDIEVCRSLRRMFWGMWSQFRASCKDSWIIFRLSFLSALTTIDKCVNMPKCVSRYLRNWRPDIEVEKHHQLRE